jgi:hypothetical protein
MSTPTHGQRKVAAGTHLLQMRTRCRSGLSRKILRRTRQLLPHVGSPSFPYTLPTILRFAAQAARRELAAGIEHDLGTKLEWTAIDDHPATENDHIHMLIRGVRDNGHELKLDRDYIRSGIRELSQSVIEKHLGPRPEHEMLIARERGIDRPAVDRNRPYSPAAPGTGPRHQL